MSDPIRDNIRLELGAQIEAFLSKGGEITEMPVSATGVPVKPQWSKGHTKKPGPRG